MMTFDTPRTKALRDLLRRHGPEGTGRIIGFSAEGEDGFWIYTDSRVWISRDQECGSFRYSTESALAKNFARECVPAAPKDDSDLIALADSGVFLADDAETGRAEDACALADWQTVAAFMSGPFTGAGRTLATVTRPAHRLDDGGVFKAYAPCGTLIGAWRGNPTVAAVRACVRAWLRAAAGVDTMSRADARAEWQDAAERGADFGQKSADARAVGDRLGAARYAALSARVLKRAAAAEAVANAPRPCVCGETAPHGVCKPEDMARAFHARQF